MNQQELTERLLKFSVKILELAKRMPGDYGSMHLSQQIIRSGTAPSLMYGEACAAESPQDFIHKMGIGLKELRETKMSLSIISMSNTVPGTLLTELMDEGDQLTRIFGSSINTVRRKHVRKR